MRVSQEQKERIIALGQEGLTPARIGNMLMMDRSLISQILRRNGIHQSRRRYTDEEKEIVVRLWKQDITLADIALETQRSIGSISHLVHHLQKEGVLEVRTEKSRQFCTTKRIDNY